MVERGKQNKLFWAEKCHFNCRKGFQEAGAPTVTWDPGNEPCLESWYMGGLASMSTAVWDSPEAASLIKRWQRRRTMAYPTWNLGMALAGPTTPRPPLSAWMEAAQVLLTSGLLPEIAFCRMRLRGIWNELLMDTRRFQPPSRPIHRFQVLLLFFFWGTKKAALMRFIPGSLRLWWRTKTQSRNPKIKLQTCQLWCIRLSASKMTAFSFSFTRGVRLKFVAANTLRGGEVLAAKFCLYKQQRWSGSWSLTLGLGLTLWPTGPGSGRHAKVIDRYLYAKKKKMDRIQFHQNSLSPLAALGGPPTRRLKKKKKRVRVWRREYLQEIDYRCLGKKNKKKQQHTGTKENAAGEKK